jgi:transposase
VDSKNRRGDVFKCLYCRHEDVADRVAAENWCTHYRQVKTILLKRFHRRLEEEQSLTVPGRTLDTVQAEYR